MYCTAAVGPFGRDWPQWRTLATLCIGPNRLRSAGSHGVRSKVRLPARNTLRGIASAAQLLPSDGGAARSPLRRSSRWRRVRTPRRVSCRSFGVAARSASAMGCILSKGHAAVPRDQRRSAVNLVDAEPP